MDDTFSFKFHISLSIFCRFMTQNGRDSGGYSIEHVFELANSTTTIDQRLLFITDSSDVPKNQFGK